MTAIFEFPLLDETLSPEEVEKITGHARKAEQATWLTNNHWAFHQNKRDEPIIGRLYARLKMAGINPSAMTTTGGWVPDFSKL